MEFKTYSEVQQMDWKELREYSGQLYRYRRSLENNPNITYDDFEDLFRDLQMLADSCITRIKYLEQDKAYYKEMFDAINTPKL